VLISIPTAISTIRGVFQAMAFLLGVGCRMMSRIQRGGTHYVRDDTVKPLSRSFCSSTGIAGNEECDGLGHLKRPFAVCQERIVAACVFRGISCVFRGIYGWTRFDACPGLPNLGCCCRIFRSPGQEKVFSSLRAMLFTAMRASFSSGTTALRWIQGFSLTTCHARRIFHIGTGIADEHAPVRHPDRAQRLGVERRIRGKQSVQIEDISGDRIDVLVA
jgi:hypothetical protein